MQRHGTGVHRFGRTSDDALASITAGPGGAVWFTQPGVPRSGESRAPAACSDAA